MNNKKWSIVSIIIAISAVLIGCNNKNEEVEAKEKISLNKGAFVSEIGAGYETYNIIKDGELGLIPTNKVVIKFNSKSGNYLFVSEGRYYINYDGKDVMLEDTRINHPKISPDGNYLFYFTNDDILEPIIIDLEKNQRFEMNNIAVISGEYIDWIGKQTLVFYGINSEKKTAGLFTYDIISGEEQMVYNIKNGYIDFLKTTEDGVFFLQETIDSNKVLKIINENNEVKEITNEILGLSDMLEVNNTIYFLGHVQDNVSSIYEVVDGEPHRVLYDFPSVINMEKGLSVDNDGNLLFIGGSDGLKEETIYKYYENSVSVLTESTGVYNFIEVN